MKKEKKAKKVLNLFCFFRKLWYRIFYYAELSKPSGPGRGLPLSEASDRLLPALF